MKEEYVDMVAARHHRPGQGDALRLQNAASVAAMILTTESNRGRQARKEEGSPGDAGRYDM
jgi:hypothetical protein